MPVAAQVGCGNMHVYMYDDVSGSVDLFIVDSHIIVALGKETDGEG